MKNKMEESKVMTESCTQLNKKAYVNLIDKDLEVLELLPYSIEKNHIEAILRASINHYYPDQESHITKLEARNKELEEALRKIKVLSRNIIMLCGDKIEEIAEQALNKK